MNCFVIMPFGNPSVDHLHSEKMEAIYSHWIKPTVESIAMPANPDIPLKCHRADKELASGDIIEHVIDSLSNAHVVIADLTGKNANVFYELGVRHAVSNRTILIAEGPEHIPFDIRTLRAITYEYTPHGMVAFRDQLKAAVTATASGPDRVDNPVRRFLLQKATNKLTSDQAPPGFDAVRSILAEFEALKVEFRTQMSELQAIIGSTTSRPSLVREDAKERVRDVEGVWESSTGSPIVFCPKVVRGELRIPYAFGGNNITSHVFNCSIVGDTVLGRFEWLEDKNTRGFIALRFVDVDALEGGWCFEGEEWEDDAGQATSPTFPSPESPGLYKLKLRKTNESYPMWALHYFGSV